MGSKGVYTSRIFGEQYASGALRGEIESKVAVVSAKSGSMEVALKLRAKEERRSNFYFALAKNMTKVQEHLRGSDGMVAPMIKRAHLEQIIRKLLCLSWSDEEIGELLEHLDDQLSELRGFLHVPSMLRSAREELISRHANQTNRTSAVANQAMYQWEEAWRKKAAKHVDAHARLVMRERAAADRQQRERVVAFQRQQRERLRRAHDANKELAERATGLVSRIEEALALDAVATRGATNGSWQVDVDGQLYAGTIRGSPVALRSPPSVPPSALASPTAARSRTWASERAVRTLVGVPALRASASLPALSPQRALASAVSQQPSEQPPATPFVDQVKRLQTPALASTRLSPSRSRARDRRWQEESEF